MDGAVLPMKEPVRPLLFWLPRVLTILFALFISVFALDVFGEGSGLLRTAGALVVHLIPTFVILMLLVIAWRREWVGALAYVSLSILYLLIAWGRFHWSAYVVISGPLLLIGFLFFLGWVERAKQA